MKKCELLCPAGNMDMLEYAIAYGADAIYLAGTRFGARKFANNFDEEQLIKAVNYSHLYNVKVYVTINTLIYDDEIDDFIDYVKFINSIGVDAVLVQDLGMMDLIHKIAPELEIHSSTQFHNDGQKTLDFLETIGVKRAVLDREMTLDEIKKLKTKLELEVFIHGALCVSYSGQCLLSSHVLNRSGNRGECAGLCRLPYREEDSDKYSYYLSMKDLFAKENIYELIDVGVTSLKIEGRMKSPEYVGYLTKIYRSLIDSYYAKERRNLTREEIKNMQILFNRGTTPGFMKNVSSSDIVNLRSPNHIGIPAGKYSRVGKNKIKLVLTETLRQGDTIRFRQDDKGMTVNFLYDKKGKLINSVEAGQIAYVDNFLEVSNDGDIRLVGSIKLKNELSKLPKRTVEITMSIKAKKLEKVSLEVRERKHVVKVEGPIAEIARNSPLTEQDIERQLKKTKDTVYSVNKINIDMDPNIFINLKDLNELRRRALDSLENLRLESKKRTFIEFKYPDILRSFNNKPELIVTVQTEEQFRVAQKYTNLIFSSNEELLKTNPHILPKYVDCQSHINSNEYMVCDYGLLIGKTLKETVYTDYMMNVTNSHTVNFLVRLGVMAVQMSVELDLDKLQNIIKYISPSKASFLIYGRIELMKMKYNPTQTDCLINQKNECFPIKRDNRYNYLLSARPIDYTDNLENIKSFGLGYWRIDFFDEEKELCAKILEKTHKIIHQE